MAGQIAERLQELGIALPAAPPAVGAYVPAVVADGWAITSGQLPFIDGKLTHVGAVGGELSEQQGQEAALICLKNALAQLQTALGDLDRVTRIVRLDGYIRSADGFFAQPKVLNPASELLAAIFGERGRHTRVAVGVATLPLGAAVELALSATVASDG